MFPSPVVILSVIAVAMAAIAFMATRGGDPTEREVSITSQQSPAATPTPLDPGAASANPAAPVEKKAKKPKVNRSATYVEVYNNSNEKGLAGVVATKVGDAGWQVVGADNWYGTVPATTVYFPRRLEDAAKRLALDLGIKRMAPSVDPMRQDRLTIILTGPLS